jgi:hypothetical protein
VKKLASFPPLGRTRQSTIAPCLSSQLLANVLFKAGLFWWNWQRIEDYAIELQHVLVVESKPISSKNNKINVHYPT